jgi:F420-non-reducing hydrogenase iron-sulfur subunit
VSTSVNGFEPQIVAFTCNWCSYAAADLAGTSRIPYPPNVRIIRVMCTGMIDPIYVLRALEEGFDGVLLAGCHIGDCHYISGNMRAQERVARLRTLLHTLGLEDERLKLEWISAADGGGFAETIREYVGQLKQLGPTPLRKEATA